MVAFISGGCNAARVVANSPGWLQNIEFIREIVLIVRLQIDFVRGLVYH